MDPTPRIAITAGEPAGNVARGLCDAIALKQDIQAAEGARTIVHARGDLEP